MGNQERRYFGWSSQGVIRANLIKKIQVDVPPTNLVYILGKTISSRGCSKYTCSHTEAGFTFSRNNKVVCGSTRPGVDGRK